MKTNPIFLLFFSLFAVSAMFAAEQADGDGYIWWEGEDFAETTIANPVDMSVAGNKNAEQRAKLSGGRWLTVSDPADGGAATIRYEITVPAEGTYDFWVRKFWKHGPFKWRFDDGEWRTLGKDISLRDGTYIGHLYWHTHNDFPGGIVPGFDANARAIALPFVASEWREFYQDYLEALLLPVNPYNGLALKDEPALGFIEINNESSLLFHTFNPQRFGAAELAYVEQDFGEWLTGKYGSIAEAQAV